MKYKFIIKSLSTVTSMDMYSL